jgi:hypothetical protein
MNNKSNSNPNLLKLKVTLAAGGLMATLIGAGLLGKEAGKLTAVSSTNVDTEAVITIRSDMPVINNAPVPEALDLDLEAIPTVAAPTYNSDSSRSSMPVARGHSSG